MSEAEKRLPWDQLDGETDKAYQAFLKYRDAGKERSLRGTFGVHGSNQNSTKVRKPAKSRIAGWSSQWKWGERVSAWDMHLADLATKEAERTVKEETQKWVKRRITSRAFYFESAQLVAEQIVKHVTPGAKVPKDNAGLRDLIRAINGLKECANVSGTSVLDALLDPGQQASCDARSGTVFDHEPVAGGESAPSGQDDGNPDGEAPGGGE